MDKTTGKISTVTAALMIGVALLFDLISIIPFVNIINAVLAGLVFTAWFWLLGAGLVNLRRVATMIISAVGEFIPVISVIPFITVGVVALIVIQNMPAVAAVAGATANKNSGSSPIKQPKQTPPPVPNRTSTATTLPPSETKKPISDITPAQPKPATPQTNIVTFPRRTMTDISPTVPFDEDEELAA